MMHQLQLGKNGKEKSRYISWKGERVNNTVCVGGYLNSMNYKNEQRRQRTFTVNQC